MPGESTPLVCPAAASSSPMREADDKSGTITYSSVISGRRITFSAFKPIPRIFIAFFMQRYSSPSVGKKRNITDSVMTMFAGIFSFSSALIKRPIGVESIKYFPATIGSIKRRTINAAGNTMPPKKPASCGTYESAASTPKKSSSFTAVFACPFKKNKQAKNVILTASTYIGTGSAIESPMHSTKKSFVRGSRTSFACCSNYTSPAFTKCFFNTLAPKRPPRRPPIKVLAYSSGIIHIGRLTSCVAYSAPIIFSVRA